MSQIDLAQQTRQAPSTIVELIKAQRSGIAMVIGGQTKEERQRRAERFARIALTAVRSTPKLAQCTQESFAAALMTCAQLDLEPNTPQGLAYLIPYGKECQFQVGYKGLLQLVYRSGQVASINADVVYRAEIEQGMFEYAKGIQPTIKHRVDLLSDLRKGEIVASYAAVVLKGGESILRVVDAQEVERAQKTSASMAAARKYGNTNSPWLTSPESMWMKTALKRLCSWLPQTEMLAQAIEAEDMQDRESSIDAEYNEVKTLDLSAHAEAIVAPPEDVPAETPESIPCPMEQGESVYVTACAGCPEMKSCESFKAHQK